MSINTVGRGNYTEMRYNDINYAWTVGSIIRGVEVEQSSMDHGPSMQYVDLSGCH